MIDYTGTYGLFTKLGIIGGFISDVNAYQKALATIKSPAFTDKFALDRRSKIISTYIASIDSEIKTSSYLVPNLLVDVASEAVIDSVTTNDPLIPKDLDSCLVELIYQMRKDNKTVARVEPTYTIADYDSSYVVSPLSLNNVFVLLKTPNGWENQFVVAEKIRFEVSSDIYSGATSQNESITATSLAQSDDKYSYDYPAGSGISTTFERVNVYSSSSGGNLVTNPTFQDVETATPLIPNDWVAISGKGTAGTNWFKTSSGITFTGSSDIQIKQEITNVESNTAYGYQIKIKLTSASALSTGSFSLDLVDSSNATLVDNRNLTTSSEFTFATQPLSTLNTYVTINGGFVTGALTPSIVNLRLMCKGTDQSGVSVSVEYVALTKMTELYETGPLVAFFSVKDSIMTKGQKIDLTINKSIPTSSGSLPYTNNTFQILFDRLFSTGSKGYTLPYSSVPTIPDTLIPTTLIN